MSTKKRPAVTGQPIATTSLAYSYNISQPSHEDVFSNEVISLIYGEKRPKHKQFMTRTYSGEDFEDPCNYGIRCGKKKPWGHLIVFDIDSSEPQVRDKFMTYLQNLGIDTDTVIVRSGGEHRGWHIYFFCEAAPTFTKTAGTFEDATIEVIGNWYAVIPPSRVIEEYKLEKGTSDFVEFMEALRRTTAITTTQTETVLRTINAKVQNLKQEKANREYILPVSHSHRLPVFRDTELFIQLLEEQSFRMYGYHQDIKIGKSFKCVLHYEENPSASITQLEDGSVVYGDFHNRSNRIEYQNGIKGNKYSPDHLDIFEVAHAIKTGNIEYISKEMTLRKKQAAKELFELIQEWNLSSQSGRHYEKEAADFKSELLQQLGGEKYSLIKKALIVYDYLVNKASTGIHAGHTWFIAPVRTVQEAMNLNKYDASKGLCLLVALKLVRRIGMHSTKEGKTFKYELALERDAISEAVKIWSRMKEHGINTARQFSQNNPLCRDLFRDRMQELFTRKPDNRKKPLRKDKQRWNPDWVKPWGGITDGGREDRKRDLIRQETGNDRCEERAATAVSLRHRNDNDRRTDRNAADHKSTGGGVVHTANGESARKEEATPT